MSFNREIGQEREVMRVLEKFQQGEKIPTIQRLARGLTYNQVRNTLNRLVEGKFVVKSTFDNLYHAVHPASYYEKKKSLWFRDSVPVIQTSTVHGKLEIWGDLNRLKRIEKELLQKHQVKRSVLARRNPENHEYEPVVQKGGV